VFIYTRGRTWTRTLVIMIPIGMRPSPSGLATFTSAVPASRAAGDPG
jgi:hypothetical protein